MNKHLYVMLMQDKQKLTPDVVGRHVDHLKELEELGKLYLSGPFSDYKGGMIIFRVDNIEEATMLAKKDPFILEGYKTFEIKTLEVANKENNYLL